MSIEFFLDSGFVNYTGDKFIYEILSAREILLEIVNQDILIS